MEITKGISRQKPHLGKPFELGIFTAGIWAKGPICERHSSRTRWIRSTLSESMLRSALLFALVGAAAAFAPSSIPRNSVMTRGVRAAPLQAVSEVGSEADVSFSGGSSDVGCPRRGTQRDSGGARGGGTDAGDLSYFWMAPLGNRHRTPAANERRHLTFHPISSPTPPHDHMH